ncbi:MAG: BsaA family SipW-dependent biofilm matrix protein [Ruminococcus sp.]|uniref:BsaA family SipW-dependent biofilm matrix protein n=1 Tax=Ruminococcus sp. TaxID=41978 RepID=UPI0025EE13C9|nr:BsaA family SipW-dependent biofilm matrix protein [Ruminococcus sp.]MCR5600162.1 BsaA family SipW-dependent biofilm matrix protein [Ruminococcus sp.]
MNNDVSKKKKTSKEKRVLIGALCVAAAVVAGSTFAWFTSTDEVTNKLSASGDYGVAIAEDFTPPEDWIPGQSIKKAVTVVNTGNVDAFIRMWFSGTMRKVTETDSGTTLDDFASATLTTSNLGGNFKYTDGTNFYRQLSDSERKIMQTGELAYAGGAYKFTSNAAGSSEETGAAYTASDVAVRLVDSDTFEPTGDGLFIFRRVNSATDGVEYSGYLRKTIGDDKCYFALTDKTVKSGGGANQDRQVFIKGLTGLTGATLINKIKDDTTLSIRTATQSTVANSGLTWTYTVPTTAADSPFNNTHPYLTASIAGAAAGSQDASIKINVELENIGDGTAPDEWQHFDNTGAKHTFYYTNDLDSSNDSSKLVANVQLDKGLKEGAYVAFDFDFDVHLDSIQIVKDTDNNELDTPVSGASGWGIADGANATAAKGTATNSGKEISAVKWS